MFQAYAYLKEKNAVEVSIDEVAKLVGNEDATLWIDISSNIEDHTDFLNDVLRVHPLAVEDMLHPRMLPKVEEYGEQLFIILHDIVLLDKDKKDEERLKTYELFIIIGKNFVLTARKHRIRAIDSYQGSSPLLTHLLSKGALTMAHAIIRKMIDNYFPLLDRIEAKLDSSELKIFNTPTSKDLQYIFSLRKDIIKLRSIATQQLDVVNQMVIGEFESLSPQGVMLSRDLYDHLYRIAEKAASFREITLGLLDAYLSQISNNMNQTMKVLTIIATMILPLGIVVGFYGMNFKFMPGLDHPYGWIYTMIGMIGISVGMLAFFKYKKWI